MGQYEVGWKVQDDKEWIQTRPGFLTSFYEGGGKSVQNSGSKGSSHIDEALDMIDVLNGRMLKR
jgi:hypothetical protein